jgi:hypothetical protein
MELLTRAPFTVGYVEYPSVGKFDPMVPFYEFETLLEQELLGTCYFRCVALTRLATIIRTGIDVEPSDMPIFVAMDPEKASEYGEVMLALDIGYLERTYKEVSAETPQQELADLRSIYPTMLTSEDGESLWLSRFPQGHTSIQSPYEWQYARWIPGDPFKALQAVLVFGQSGGDTRNRVLELLGSITN